MSLRNPVLDLMRSIASFSVLLLFSVMILHSCSHSRSGGDSDGEDKRKLKEPLISANEYLQDTEETLIEDFISRYDWNMEKSSNGLRIMIYEDGSGPKVEPGDALSLSYELRLINGQIIYSSEVDGLMKFIQGDPDIEKGLNEGVLMMHEGDRAKLIIPSHLGYGLPGDQNRIPPKATLIYDIKVIEVHKPKR